MEKFLKINVKSGWRIHGSLGQYDPESCKIGLRWKKLATICRNYEIFLLEVPFVKLKTTVKNYHEQSLHQLECGPVLSGHIGF